MAYGNGRTPRLAMAGAVLCLLWATAARAGSIEDRPDGTTVIHLTMAGGTIPHPTSTDPSARGERAIVREFVRRFPETFAAKYAAKYKAHPEIYGRHNWDKVEVDVREFSGIRVEGVEVDLLAIAGGMSPDVLYVNFRKSDTYIQSGFLYPLDNPEDRYIVDVPQDELDFRVHPKIWPVIRRNGPDGKQHVWAIPHGGAVGKVLIYRKDLFDESGLAYPDKDWTWENLYAASRKIADPKRGIYGIMLGRGKHESWYWMSFLWSAGGECMVYDKAADQWRCVFGSREAALALEFYTRLCTEKWTTPGGKIHRGYAYKEAAESGPKWERGEIGMQLAYINETLFHTINPDLHGMAPIPLGPPDAGGKRMRGGEFNNRMMGLFAGIKQRAIRDAAWEYIRFYSCKEAVRIKTEVMVEGGFGRFVNPKYLRMYGYPEIIRLAPKGWSEIFQIAVDTGKLEPYGRNSNFAYDMMTFPIQEAEQMSINDRLPADFEERVTVLQDLLGKWNAKANDEMIGIVTPRVRFWRNVTAVVVLTMIVVVFGFVFRKVFRIFSPPKTGGGGPPAKWAFWKYRWAYLLLLPALLSILLWRYVPLVWGSTMAFQDYQLMKESTWVWVKNFGDVLWDSSWWWSVWFSVKYSFFVMTLTFLPPIFLAILLQEVPRGRLLFRTIYYLPAVVTGLVVIILWKQFYDPSEFGFLNRVIMKIPAIAFVAVGAVLLAVAMVFVRRMLYHQMRVAAAIFALGGVVLFVASALAARSILWIPADTIVENLIRMPGRLFSTAPEPYQWLTNPNTAMLSCVIPMVWAGMGPGCLIYLAALKGIPNDLYEAADVDGGNFIDKILFVVFPILKPLILINFIGVFIASFYAATRRVLVMTGGGGKTEVAGLHIFYKAFLFLKFGPATAMAWILAVMLIGFTVNQLRILSRLEFRTTGDKN